MENKTTWLSRSECSAMRGLAILGIVLHNYCHWLGPAVKENEYLFYITNSEHLWYALTHPDAILPVHLVSYFGHYGVPVFLFLSGYGLVMKYGGMADLPVWRFIRYHYLKLFGMLVAGFVAFTVVDAVTPGAFRYHADNVIAQLLMYINLLPQPNSRIWPGPYWFFGLMMQFYIIYRLVLHRRHWGVAAVLVLVCWMAQAVCGPESGALKWLRYNSVGSMLPFCGGVLLARLQPREALCGLSRWQWAAAAVVLIALIVALCFGYQTWLWAPIVVVAASVAVVKALPAGIFHALVWTGGISAAMFVIHPVLRKIFIPISRHGDIYDGLVLYIVATMAVAWLFNQIINKIPNPKL